MKYLLFLSCSLYAINYENVFDNNIMLGYDVQSMVSKDIDNENKNTYTVDSNIKFGISPIKDNFIYSIIGVDGQYTKDKELVNYDYCFAYGIGYEYKIKDNLSLNVKHRVSNIKGEANLNEINYDKETSFINLKYSF